MTVTLSPKHLNGSKHYRAAEKRESVRFRIPRFREGRLFETRSGEALLRMRPVISKVYLTLRRPEGPSRRVLIRKAAFFRTLLMQYFEQRLRIAQISRIQPLSEPSIDRGEDAAGLFSSVLLLQQPDQAHRCPQLP